MNLFKKKYYNVSGLVPSPKDERDYLLSSYIPQIKRYPEVLLPPFDLDILNQQTNPSCVGMSCAVIKQYNELKEKDYKVFDGNWIYRECKKIDGLPNLQGTFFRSGLQVLKNTGAKPITGENESIYRISSYAKVDDMSFEGLKKAIFLYGILLAGFRGTNEGWVGEYIRAPRQGETEWGHAVALVGYEKNYIIGQNSWGDRHNKGLFKFDKNYLPFEAWAVLVDMINEPRQDVKTGWVARNFLSNGITTANLNVRETPSLRGKLIKTLRKGTRVEEYGTPNVSVDGFWWTEIIDE